MFLCDPSRIAPRRSLAAGFGALCGPFWRAESRSMARREMSRVPTSQAPALVCVRVMRATCATCRRGCACRERPRADTTLFPWDIGTAGHRGIDR